MKSGIKTGDLRDAWRGGSDGFDRRDVVRLVQWRKGDKFPKVGEHLLIDLHGVEIGFASVHHPMADARKLRLTSDVASKPVVNRGDRRIKAV